METDVNEAHRLPDGPARLGRVPVGPGSNPRARATELEALEAVTVLSEGVTSAPAVPGLNYAFLELDGEEFVAVGEGESTMIFTGSGSVPI